MELSSGRVDIIYPGKSTGAENPGKVRIPLIGKAKGGLEDGPNQGLDEVEENSSGTEKKKETTRRKNAETRHRERVVTVVDGRLQHREEPQQQQEEDSEATFSSMAEER